MSRPVGELTAAEWDALERGRQHAERHRPTGPDGGRWAIRMPDGTTTPAYYTSEEAAAFWLDYETERRPALVDAQVVQILDERGRPVDQP